MPIAQVIAAHDPPCAVTPVEHGQVALHAAIMPQHRGQTRPPGRGQFAGHNVIQPRFGTRTGHFEPGEPGDIQKAHFFAGCTAFFGNDVMCV